jgi:hypothetical protein
MEEDYSHTITYDKTGFTIDKPVRDETHFVKWDSVETIIYGDSRIYHDHEEFIIYLSSPALIILKENAWWLNKMFFWITPKKSKKIRLRTDFVKGFNSFNEKIKDYLQNVITVDDQDSRKGTLIQKEVQTTENKTIVTEKWKPLKTENLHWKMVYDKHNRTVNDIYEEIREFKLLLLIVTTYSTTQNTIIENFNPKKHDKASFIYC